jgi:hypothetical protein
MRAEAVGADEPLPSSEAAVIRYEADYGLASADGLQSRFDAANAFEMPSLLAELDQRPDSPVKAEMMRSALARWAAIDGAAATAWASLNAQGRRFLPDVLQEWAGSGADASASAWEFAKTAMATDPDEADWRSPRFVTAAFRGMAATPGEAVWTELAALSGSQAIHAMMGMADFASNRQINTDFAAAVESKTLSLGSDSLSAAFYAAAGHIEVAKDDLASVTDGEQWHVIAREIAKQQAVFEPSKSLEWLVSQFEQPADAILDVVESIGLMHALNAEDVLAWLRNCPESEERTAGTEKLLQKFPELRTDLAVQVINQGFP